MTPDETKKIFLEKFSVLGAVKFYEFLINYATNRISLEGKIKKPSPEVELMDFSDSFIGFYRKEGSIAYLEISKYFRKASHFVYRAMLKKKLIKKNVRFLNMVD